MKMTFDFNANTPPRITEAMLARERQRRRQRKCAVFLSFASFLWNAAAVAFGCVLLLFNTAAGCAALALWGASLIAAGFFTVIFADRKEVVLWLVSQL